MSIQYRNRGVLPPDSIQDTEIDWGTGTGQVGKEDITGLTTADTPQFTGLTLAGPISGVTTFGLSSTITQTGGDYTLYENANNADPYHALGTSATEALKIQAICAAASKILQTVRFSTATADATADYGKYIFDVDGTDIIQIDDGGLNPATTDGATLGDTGLMWSDLFLASGGVINFNNGNYTLTHAASALVLVQAAAASGVPIALTLTGGAHTGITAATECIGMRFDFSANKTWVAGAGPLASQREIQFLAPTYIGDVGGALTMTDAATVYINAAPTAGANMTITRAWSLWCAAGKARFDGGVDF